jgi:hypothetical protein
LRILVSAFITEVFAMEISSVRCLVARRGEMLGMFSLDLSFIDGAPYAIFEWAELEDGSREATYATPLDSRFLERLPEGGDVSFQYRMSVEDPRPVE